LLRHADVVSARLELAAGQLGEIVAERGARLRVGAFPSALATVVPAAVAQLTLEQPETRVDAIEGTQEELAAGVRDGGLHAAVCFQGAAQPRREHEGATREDLHEEPFAALLPRGHRLAGTGPVRLADLAGDVWVAPSREGLIARACRAAGFEPAIRYVSRDPLANRALVAAGLAVTISPSELAAELHGIAVAEVREAPRRTVYALLPDAGATRLARAFVAALVR